MPSMARRLFTILSAFSLLLCAAAVALWARSWFASDYVERISVRQPPAPTLGESRPRTSPPAPFRAMAPERKPGSVWASQRKGTTMLWWRNKSSEKRGRQTGPAVVEPMEGRVLMTVTMTDAMVSSCSTDAGVVGEPGAVEVSYRSAHPGGLNVCLGDGSVR